MDLRKRLAQLDKLSRRPEPPRPAVPAGAPCTPADLGLAAAPGGETWLGGCWRDLPPPALPDLAGLLPRHWDATADPEELLFLDTETTGLAGGTGTVAFLVGLAWWEQGRLRIEQHFLPEPAHEAALLAAVAARAGRHKVVVSFNGASFDWPLLRTRALLNRMSDPLGELAGWDLLVPARRVWGRQLADCRQQTLEAEVCGLRRGPGDIPGDRIPQAWFDFLAGGDAEPLQRVLEHNRRDMEGMAQVLRAVCAVAGQLLLPPPAGLEADWRLAWALGRVCERRRADGAAAGWLRLAAQAAAARRERRFLVDALRVLKRDGDWTGALDLIDRAVARGDAEPWLHREAAIIWEHRLGDPDKALAHARRTGDDRRVDRLSRRAPKEAT